MLYIATGALSAISDNVFVATVYITEVKAALLQGVDRRASSSMTLAVAINTGTNIPSVATPNGQAAFLFLLTSLARAADPAGVYDDDLDGAALYRGHDGGGSPGRDLAAVKRPFRP